MEARPGQTVDIASASVAVLHAAPVVEALGTGYVRGFAIKTKQMGPDTGYGATANKQVQVGEAYKIQVKGKGYVANSKQEGGTFAKGDVVYIIPSGGNKNLLTATSNTGANPKYGVVTEIAGERGVATGFMRVDLDLKDSF